MQRSGLLTALASRRLFASTAFVGAACGLWMASEMTTVAGVTACLCLVQGLATLQGLGYGANYLDVSKYNGGVVTGVGNTWEAPGAQLRGGVSWRSIGERRARSCAGVVRSFAPKRVWVVRLRTSLGVVLVVHWYCIAIVLALYPYHTVLVLYWCCTSAVLVPVQRPCKAGRVPV